MTLRSSQIDRQEATSQRPFDEDARGDNPMVGLPRRAIVTENQLQYRKRAPLKLTKPNVWTPAVPRTLSTVFGNGSISSAL
jgi:hypothetical protein